MKVDRQHIIDQLRTFPYISNVEDNGDVDEMQMLAITFPIEGKEPLTFSMRVAYMMSPMRLFDVEPVVFYNKALLAYPHIMDDGHLCLHTPDCVTWDDRITEEIEALHRWIQKYYVREEQDEHYEDLVIDSVRINGARVQFYYTQLDAIPSQGSCGYVAYTKYASDKIGEQLVESYLVQGVVRTDGVKSYGEWSTSYKEMAHKQGLFVMLAGTPARYGKFAVNNYQELSEWCSEDQLRFLYEKLYKEKEKFAPIFWGYETPNGSLRWIVTYPDESMHFIIGEKILENGVVKWVPKLVNLKMNIVDASDSSYEQFFGRGRYPDAIVDKKILIMGVGAIGSIVATTLVRGGVKHIALCDFDLKHPGNVCRSEYMFGTGLNFKTDELMKILTTVSPFVDVKSEETYHLFLKKTDLGQPGLREEILNQYDIIFDCTIDGELMWAMEHSPVKSQIVNMSISNGAKELVCAFSPGVSDFVYRVYTEMITKGSGDMFNPEGCWSPTFKASYNDVQIVVQYAMRYVAKMLSGVMDKANFLVQEGLGGLQLIRW